MDLTTTKRAVSSQLTEHQQNQLQRAINGDSRALEELVRKHYDDLFEFIDHNLSDRYRRAVAVEDILQNTLIQICQSISTLEDRGEGSFGGWIRSIAKHRILDAIKAQRAKKRSGIGARIDAVPDNSDGYLAIVEMVATGALSPSSKAASAEAAIVVRESLQKLQPDYQEALKYRYFEGRTVAETAEQMGRTPRSIHMLCHRALKQLRDLLGRSSQYLSSNTL